MKPLTKIILALVLGGIVLIAALLFVNSKNPSGVLPPVERFASCIKDSGAKFYGAFWCPHCQKQKTMFGRSASKLLPYIECSNPNGQGQLQICIDNNISGYPTWEFADGSRLSGEQSFETLSEKTGCPAPF